MEKRYYYKDANGNHYNFKSPHFMVDKEIEEQETILNELGEEEIATVTKIVKVVEDGYTELTEEQFIAETTQPQFTEEQIVEQGSVKVLNDELSDLLQWFEDYDVQIAQYNRCQRLGIEFASSLGTIQEMDNLAVQKAQRITEIRELLKENH